MRVSDLELCSTTLCCLHTAGIVSIQQLTSNSCTELMEHPAISMDTLYEIIRKLNEHDLMLPNDRGRVRKPSPRNLEMFRLRFVEGLTLRETGQRTGVSRSRVHQLLHMHYGTARWPPSPKDRQHLRHARERRRAESGLVG